MHPSRTDIIDYRKAKLRIVENALVASKLAIFLETTLGLPYAPFQSFPIPLPQSLYRIYTSRQAYIDVPTKISRIDK